MIRVIRKLKFRIFIIFLSSKWMFRTMIGDWVLYRGQKYQILNGVRCESWHLIDLTNCAQGWVPRKDCKKIWTLSGVLKSFRYGYRFYMTNWYSIWISQGIKPWMRACRIW